MSLIVSHIAPIYFPLLHSPFIGTTLARAACEPDSPDFFQLWADTDTLNFQIHNPTETTRDYGLVIGADYYAGTTTGNGYYNFSIPLLPYRGQTIEPVLVEGPDIPGIIQQIDVAHPMSILPLGSNCITCSNLISYNGACSELQVYYGPAGQPEFTHYLRIPSGIEYEQAENENELYKNASGSWQTEFAEADSIFRHFVDFVPLWMILKLNHICLSKRVWVEGGEVVLQSPYRRSEQDRLTNMYRADARFRIKHSPYQVATCC